jgi:alkylation response protein AidB-like acyl-CoA dehydrogenase
VNFDFNDEQRAIRESAREMLAKRYGADEIRRLALEDERGFTDEQWAELAGLGWPGIFVSEEDGGQGLGVVELTILQEELGYALAPTPFFSNAAAGLLLAAAATADQRERYLRPMAAGEARGTLALYDAGAELEPTGSSLTGTKIAVPDAAAADFLVVAAADGRHFVVETQADGVTIEPATALDPTRKLFTVHLDGAEAHQLEADEPAIARAYAAIATALAAESTGVAQRALEMAVEYARDRKQFERPIGAYQAVSHRCAQMLLETEGARSATYYAAWALDHEPESAALAASMAKAYASDAGWRVTASALQVHGGIGFTWEHDLHFFLKRARANAAAHGDSRHHRERVAALAGI